MKPHQTLPLQSVGCPLAEDAPCRYPAGMTFHTPHSLYQLQRRVATMEGKNARLLALMALKGAQWEATKAALFEQFRLAIERQFGPSTEKYRVEQANLLINEAEAAVDEESADEAGASSINDESTTNSDDTPSRHRARVGQIALPFVFDMLPTLDAEDELSCLLPWRWKEAPV
ncbi:transposase [Salinicola rhizosphaerae]